MPLNLGAGFVWGTLVGGMMTVVAACLSAACGFLIARYLAVEQTREFLERRGLLWILQNIQRHDWQLILFARLNPIVPFGLTNYLFGLTSISFSRYMMATFISNVPLSFFFAALGNALSDLALDADLRKGALNAGLALLALCALYVAKKVFTRPSE
jgi:uncharacterized membrane protein YdjX (TVP38/TMEM64 family)